MKKIIILLITTLFIFATENKEEEDYNISQKLDYYHYMISKWIVDKSDDVDKYLSNYDDGDINNKTRLELSYEIGKNTLDKKFTNNFGFYLNLSLPRLKNKFKLEFQKVKKSISAFDNKEYALSKDNTNLEDNYKLGINYKGINKKKYKLSFDAGFRFNEIFFDPYVGVIAGKSIRKDEKVDSNIRNTLRYYFSGEVKDILSSKYLYKKSDTMLFGWMGNLVYSNTSNTQTLYSELFSMKMLDYKRFYRYGLITTGNLKNFLEPKSDEVEIYAKYHDRLMNKDWLYYEVTPSVNWRRKDNFKTSYGLKVKIGATFGAAD